MLYSNCKQFILLRALQICSLTATETRSCPIERNISKVSAYESMDLQHMENGLSGGGGGGGGGGGNAAGGGLSEIDFQRLAQIIATSIQKVQQNGE